MRRIKFFILVFLLSCSLPLAAASYKGENIDGKNFAASLWLKGDRQKYNVSVVFVATEARIIFSPDQVLPRRFTDTMSITLHLKDEIIEDSFQVPLLELVPPADSGESSKDKKNWKIAAYWILDVKIIL